jgi:hypothetical protein
MSIIGRASDGGCGRERLSPRFEDDEDVEAARIVRAERLEYEADARRDEMLTDAIDQGRNV